MVAFTVPAEFSGFSSHKDGGAGIRFVTNELDAGELMAILQSRGMFGHLMFSPNQIDDADVPKQMAQRDGKSPSQRLRAVIYLYWVQQGKKNDFEQFYARSIEKLIEKVKAKLDND